MSDAPSKRFRLSIVNAAEDVPRLIRAYGKACDGEFGLVLRPPEHRGVLVLIRKDGAALWQGDGGDAPEVPSEPISAKDAVARVRAEQKAVAKTGPITLRGQWSGWLVCDGGKPRVELSRKLATYGVLTLTSGEGGWTWTIARAEKWFTRPGADTGAATTLVGAIEAGLARAMGLLGEACSVRDSRRRAAMDADYATVHPVKPAKEGKDPTERIREPKAGRVPKGSATKEPAATSAAEAPKAPESAKSQWEVDFDRAMATAGPGNWRALTVLYASPEDAKTQKALSRWLDKYAKDAEDAVVLLDGRDNAGEAGIRDDAYDEIARRLQFKPAMASAKQKGPQRAPTPTAAADPAKDKALLDAFSKAISSAISGPTGGG